MVWTEIAKEVGKLVAKESVKKVAKEGVKQGVKAGLGAVVAGGIKKAVSGRSDDDGKFCRVCGIRIKAESKVLKARRKCKKCRHRTHHHCMGADGICKKCHEEST